MLTSLARTAPHSKNAGMRRMILALALAGITFTAAPVKAATITAGSPPSSAPTTFLDTKTGKISGFLPEIAAEIAKREKLDMTFDAVAFSTLIQSVISGKIDMIVAGMTPTDKRKEVIDFSQPVLAFGEGVFVRDNDSRTFTSAKDFSGLVVGAMAGTDYGDAVTKMGLVKEVKYYESPADLARDVSLGRVDLGMNDYPILKGQQSSGALKGMHVVEGYEPVRKFDVAFAVRKGNTELLAKINDALTAMKSDGSLDTILSKWGMSRG
jgi:polar amino acid transport system substrate-binding protein